MRSKAAFDSNGHASHGVAIHRAIVAGMKISWRVDRWDDAVFYAPAGSLGSWSVIE